MTDLSFWIAVIGALGGVGAVGVFIKFWMDMGATRERITTIEKKAAQIDDIYAEIGAFKVMVAQNYATSHSLAAVENNLANSLQGVYGRLDTMNERLDRILEAFVSQH